MQGLVDYGSDSESGGESPPTTQNKTLASTHPTSSTTNELNKPPSRSFSGFLPPPKNSPTPHTPSTQEDSHSSKKRIVNITLPVNISDQNEQPEEERPLKKANNNLSSLSSMLPAPKNPLVKTTTKPIENKTTNNTKATTGATTAPTQIRRQALLNNKTTKNKYPIPQAKDSTTDKDNTDIVSTPIESEDNDFFGVTIPTPSPYSLSLAPSHILPPQGIQQEQALYGAEYPPQNYEYTEYSENVAQHSLPENVPRDFIDAFAGTGQVKEINQKSIMGDSAVMRQQRMNATKKEMGKFALVGVVPTASKPSLLQKRKHQLSSLVWEAQQKELELMERGAASNKTKLVTRGKYGW